MGLQSTFNAIFYGNNNVSIIGVSGVDLYINEKHRSDYNITSFSVEDGADVSDHSVKQPEILTLSGHISNLNSILNRISIKDQAKIQNGFQQLITAGDNKTILKVITNARIYDNMLIENIDSDPLDVETGGAGTFTISLKRVNIVSVEDDKITPAQVSGDDNPAKNQFSVQKNGLQKALIQQFSLPDLSKLGFIS